MTTYTHTIGDLEYDIEIDGGDYYVSDIHTDLGIDVEDLFFIDKKTMKQVNYGQWLADQAYQDFLDNWGSAKAMNDASYADDCNALRGEE
jgi:hypothetical protein